MQVIEEAFEDAGEQDTDGLYDYYYSFLSVFRLTASQCRIGRVISLFSVPGCHPGRAEQVSGMRLDMAVKPRDSN